MRCGLRPAYSMKLLPGVDIKVFDEEQLDRLHRPYCTTCGEEILPKHKTVCIDRHTIYEFICGACVRELYRRVTSYD